MIATGLMAMMIAIVFDGSDGMIATVCFSCTANWVVVEFSQSVDLVSSWQHMYERSFIPPGKRGSYVVCAESKVYFCDEGQNRRRVVFSFSFVLGTNERMQPAVMAPKNPLKSAGCYEDRN